MTWESVWCWTRIIYNLPKTQVGDDSNDDNDNANEEVDDEESMRRPYESFDCLLFHILFAWLI